MHDDPVLFALHHKLDAELKKIARLFRNPKITLVIRNPDLADGDVVLTDDDPEAVIAAIRCLEKP